MPLSRLKLLKSTWAEFKTLAGWSLVRDHTTQYLGDSKSDRGIPNSTRRIDIFHHLTAGPGHQRLQVSHQRGAKNNGLPSIWSIWSPRLTRKRPSCHAKNGHQKFRRHVVRSQQLSGGFELCSSWMPKKKLFFFSMNHVPRDCRKSLPTPHYQGKQDFGEIGREKHPFSSGANLITMAWRSNWSNWSTLGTACDSSSKGVRPTWIGHRPAREGPPWQCHCVKADWMLFLVMSMIMWYPRLILECHRTWGTSLVARSSFEGNPPENSTR